MQTETLRPNLHRILVPSPTLPPATTTNAWITEDHGGFVVDPAAHTDKNRQILLDTLEHYAPSAVFLTHHHHDHVGAAEVIREYFDIPILAHTGTANLVPFRIDRLVEHGERLHTGTDTWTAIHTPGHAPGHLCLLSDVDHSLIAGDMVAGEGTILINPKEGSIREYIQSLELLRTFGPSRLLPAHGQALDTADSILIEYIRHRKQRIVQVWDALSTTPKTARDIAREIYTELPAAYLGMAAIQVQCGLLFLREDHAVTHSEGSGWVRNQSSYSITI